VDDQSLLERFYSSCDDLLSEFKFINSETSDKSGVNIDLVGHHLNAVDESVSQSLSVRTLLKDEGR
jgi:hypothetical protein